MAYTYEKQNDDYGLIKEGEYEVTIEKAETKELPSGKKKIALMFRIRNDVEQQFQNRVLFEDIWQEKDTDYYNRKRLNQLMGTQEFEDGTTFPTIHDLLDEIKGRPLVAKVTVTHDDYRGEDVNRILYYKSSEHKPKELGQQTPKLDDVTEDDLPF